MRLTTKGRFAVTAMMDLALCGGKDPVTLAGISARQRISLSYLEQLFGKLRRAGMVVSARGAAGGYSLARPAAEIAMSVALTLGLTGCRVIRRRLGGSGRFASRTSNCRRDGSRIWTAR